MTQSNSPDALLPLLDALCSDRLSAEQHARLEELLRDDSAAQRTYLDYLDLHIGLKSIVAVESGLGVTPVESLEPPAVLPLRQRIPLSRRHALLASLVVVAGVLVAVMFVTREVRAPLHLAATVTDLAGDVLVYGADAQVRAAEIGMEIREGERVETAGPGAVAVMAFEDGTRLALVNDSLVTCVAARRKSVTLHRGVVSAQVAPQPPDEPMRLGTPGAEIEVLGTRFALAATPNRTELNVSQGRVKLTRISDGRTVEVTQGQGVVTGEEANLSVRESGGPLDTWDVDFEAGTPEGWIAEHVKSGLPAGSRGAIGTTRQDRGGQVTYSISTRDEWVQGLFAVQADSHLHITLKMEQPGWLNVFLSTRGSDATHPTWAIHNFNEVPFWPPKPGQWRTVTIPLAKFRRKRDGVFRNEPPVVGEVAYSLGISSTEPDRGLVIDRIWVTRGGPGKVEARPLP